MKKHGCLSVVSSFSPILIAAGLLTGCLAGQNEQFFETPIVDATAITNPDDETTVLPTTLCALNSGAAACNTTPMVTTPGVVTVLFTLGQIPADSAALIASNAVKYASPKRNPKILFLKDFATAGEDEGDPQYIIHQLLGAYDVTYGEINAVGLDISTTVGYDVVMVSNPGHPLTTKKTYDTLMAFTGGVVLIGDDLSHTQATPAFNMAPLTGLTYVANGASLTCNGHSYRFDNNLGYQYRITMNEAFLPGLAANLQNYLYGNDLDITTSAGNEVLAWGAADPSTCNIGLVPAVVRHPK